jgi:hypothetical protein
MFLRQGWENIIDGLVRRDVAPAPVLRLFDPEHATVDAVPLKPEDFRFPHPRIQRDDDHGVQVGTATTDHLMLGGLSAFPQEPGRLIVSPESEPPLGLALQAYIWGLLKIATLLVSD